MRKLLDYELLTDPGADVLVRVLRQLNGLEQGEEKKDEAEGEHEHAKTLHRNMRTALDKVIKLKTGHAVESAEVNDFVFAMDAHLGLGTIMPVDALSRDMAASYLSGLTNWSDQSHGEALEESKDAEDAARVSSADNAYGYCEGVEPGVDFDGHFAEIFTPCKSSDVMPSAVCKALTGALVLATSGHMKSLDKAMRGAMALQLTHIMQYDWMAEAYQRSRLAFASEGAAQAQQLREVMSEFLKVRLHLKSGSMTAVDVGCEARCKASFPEVFGEHGQVSTVDPVAIGASFERQMLAWYQRRDSYVAYSVEIEELRKVLADQKPLPVLDFSDKTGTLIALPLSEELVDRQQETIMLALAHDQSLTQDLQRLVPDAKPLEVTHTHYAKCFDDASVAEATASNLASIKRIRYYLDTCYASYRRGMFSSSVDPDKKASIESILTVCKALQKDPLNKTLVHALVQAFHNQRYIHMTKVSYAKQSYGRMGYAFLLAMPAINAIAQSVTLTNDMQLQSMLADWKPLSVAERLAEVGGAVTAPAPSPDDGWETVDVSELAGMGVNPS